MPFLGCAHIRRLSAAEKMIQMLALEVSTHSGHPGCSLSRESNAVSTYFACFGGHIFLSFVVTAVARCITGAAVKTVFLMANLLAGGRVMLCNVDTIPE